jgi:hypothetical protein
MNADALKKNFLPKYKADGELNFYKFLLSYAVQRLVAIEKKEYEGSPPNLEFLDYYNQFIILYRREGEEIYLEIAKVFRKAAHKIYRVMLKKKMTPRNDKFLNLV